MSTAAILKRFALNTALLLEAAFVLGWIAGAVWANPRLALIAALMATMALCLGSGVSAAGKQAQSRQRLRSTTYSYNEH